MFEFLQKAQTWYTFIQLFFLIIAGVIFYLALRKEKNKDKKDDKK